MLIDTALKSYAHPEKERKLGTYVPSFLFFWGGDKSTTTTAAARHCVHPAECVVRTKRYLDRRHQNVTLVETLGKV